MLNNDRRLKWQFSLIIGLKLRFRGKGGFKKNMKAVIFISNQETMYGAFTGLV